MDDHEDIVLCVSTLLGRHGYEVLSATDAASAISLGIENDFDVLVSDINLPDGTGWDVLKALSDIKTFPSIAITADSSPDAIARHAEGGFDLRLSKPFSVNILMKHIEAILHSEHV